VSKSRPDVSKLIAAAEQAASAGRHADAIAAWRNVLVLDPDHPRALNTVGNWALNSGDARGGRALLERAAAAAPTEPAVQFNLSLAQRAVGDHRAALTSLNRALSLDPYFVHAMFQKGLTLEALDRPKEAALAFRDFLRCAPPEVQASEQFEASLSHARSRVDANSEALAREIESHLKGRIAAGGAEPRSRRFAEGLDALLGRKRIYVSEPTFFCVPRLPAVPFISRELTPWLDLLERGAAEIRAEAERILGAAPSAQAGFEPYVQTPAGVPVNQWANLNYSSSWSAYFLWKSGRQIEAHCDDCPKTAQIVAQMPLARIPNRAPNVFFSVLKPRTKIPPHNGVSNVRCGVHLPLIVPERCGFRVGAETRTWKQSEAWVFDDTIDHEAWNDSDAIRVILILDVWNPYLDDDERQSFRAMMAGFDAYYGASAAPWDDR
jgi:aspartyl/asparaginyl beta-hydroxylase (cupin superfamily)